MAYLLADAWAQVDALGACNQEEMRETQPGWSPSGKTAAHATENACAAAHLPGETGQRCSGPAMRYSIGCEPNAAPGAAPVSTHKRAEASPGWRRGGKP